nr:hypothetical protein [Tanacetum cinerariifolium]
CQPIDQNVDFSDSDQIQIPQYPDVHPSSQEISEEVFQAKGDLMKDRSTFFNDDENHSVQNKESLENSSNEIDASNSNQEKEKPQQDSDIRQLIREECCIEVSEEQKQKIEDTILELVEICRQKELYCMHDNVEDLIESALNSKLLSINSNSQHFDKKEHEVKNVVEQPAERGTHKREYDVPVCENSPTCDDNSEIFSDSNNDDDISSDDDDFEDIEYEEVNLEDIQDVVLCEKLLSINHLIANIESLNDNPTSICVLNSSASIPIFEESNNSLLNNFSPEYETFCDHTEKTRSGNTTTHAHNSLPEYDSFCFEIEPDQEKLTSAAKNDTSDDSTNDPLLEEVDLFLVPSGIENFACDSERDICFLEALLIDDSIPFPVNESFDFENDPSFPRPPPEPPDDMFDF